MVHEPLKGGREPESIYLRIAAGMPGTAHPAALNLPQEQLIELVDYIRSLARPNWPFRTTNGGYGPRPRPTFNG